MKSQLIKTEPVKEPVTFPCLRKWGTEGYPSYIVLFCSETTGTVVHTEDSAWKVGEQNDCFIDCSDPRWKKLSENEKVVLSS